MESMVRNLKQRIKMLMSSKSERRHAFVGPSHLWKMKRDFQIAFLKDVGLKPESYLLDIGCGILRGGIPLIGHLQEGHYFGIESRTEVLNEARRELEEAALDWKHPTLLAASDISQVRIPQKFDFIWAFSVLIHMSDDILHDTLCFVRQHLSDTAYFYANVNVGVREEGKWLGFPVV